MKDSVKRARSADWVSRIVVALIIQGLMGLLVVGSLIYKRQRESPRRKWKIWILDISKQMTGQVFVHILVSYFEERSSPSKR